MHPDPLPLQRPEPPDPAEQALWRAELAAAQTSPWRASLFMRRLEALRPRLVELRDWLASLPRRLRRGWVRRWAPVLPAAAFLLALAAGPAQANTITVDVGAGGNCSLAEAIGNANDTITGQPNADCADADETGADTIQFQNANTTYGYIAPLPDITTDVTIQGNGDTTIQRTGGPGFSVLVVSGGGSLGLSNVTISGGGGAAFVYGGGIHVVASTLDATSVTISGNSADLGGGIHAEYSTVSLTSVTISGNTASYGGGIAADNSTVSLTSTTISGNSANFGGGITAFESTVSLTSATISGNSATYGGGIHVYENGTDSIVSLISTTITGNTASAQGGGINAESATVSATSSTISNNSAPYGGGIYAYAGSSVNVTGSMISGNTAGVEGGGIYARSSTVSLTSTTISGNSASYAAGIFTRSSTASLTSATISGNSATGDCGGALFQFSSTANLTSATISGNSAGTYSGGGVCVDFGSSMDLTDSTVSGNSAATSGGGIFIATSVVNLTNVTISGNSAGTVGGGIHLYGGYSTVNLIHVTVTGNSAATSGGGIYSTTASFLGIQSSIVAGQSAGADCAGDLVASGGYNIESATSCGFTSTGDQQNVSTAQLNLGPLALNPPGTTRTHALGPGSFALDKIPPGTNGCGTTITTDQRGVSRPQGTNCDVGAYELEVATPTPTPVLPTAAQVTHFAATADPTGRIRITWETANEVEVVGFRLQRAPEGSGAWADLGALIPARGSAAGGARYTAMDTPGVGSFVYRLEIVNAGGPPSTHGAARAAVRALRAFLPIASAR